METLVAIVAVVVAFGSGSWMGARTMGRNLDRVLAAMTPEELKVLGRRIRARHLLATSQSPSAASPSSENAPLAE